MSNYELRKGKHLIIEDRLIIEWGLEENYTLKEIADILMLALLIDSCSQKDVKNAIDNLYEVLGHEVFKHGFPVILTDNDSEFKNPEVLELDAEGNKRIMNT